MVDNMNDDIMNIVDEECWTSNLREWYERHVIEPMLAALEQFQERDSR